MMGRAGMSSLDIDLTRMHRRTVTSFYSNLVTRPTGRAVRMRRCAQLADATLLGYDRLWKRLVGPRFGDMALARIKPRMVAAWR